MDGDAELIREVSSIAGSNGPDAISHAGEYNCRGGRGVERRIAVDPSTVVQMLCMREALY